MYEYHGWITVRETAVDGDDAALVTSGIYGWDEIPDVLTSGRAGHRPVFVLEK
ncbi:Imm7 family immunity protein [Streptomyces iakyrus]|uniref:Imm7 family immunity protein n=1 Tax=Streptomyces iakyrus TaxID=68219 RepID=UPI000A8E36B6|nr:Imm7 family immunity protein [Streptomyces iakyrus]